MRLKILKTTIYPLFLLSISANIACQSTQKTQAKNEPILLKEEKKLDIEGAKQAYIHGNAYLDQHQFQPALSSFKQSIALNPKPWQTYMNAAIASIMNANTIEALDFIQKAYDHGGDKQQVLFYNLGNIYQERGLYHHAIDAYRMGFSVGDPNDIDSLINLAASYALIYDEKGAHATYDRILELDPNAIQALHGKAFLKSLSDDHAGLLQMYNEILMRRPDYGPVLYAKGDLLFKLNRLPEARETLLIYKKHNPQGPYIINVDSLLDTINKRLKNIKTP